MLSTTRRQAGTNDGRSAETENQCDGCDPGGGGRASRRPAHMGANRCAKMQRNESVAARVGSHRQNICVATLDLPKGRRDGIKVSLAGGGLR